MSSVYVPLDGLSLEGLGMPPAVPGRIEFIGLQTKEPTNLFTHQAQDTQKVKCIKKNKKNKKKKKSNKQSHEKQKLDINNIQ